MFGDIINYVSEAVPYVFVVAHARSAVTSIAVFYLWNALLPDLFEWPRISLWQACGLNFLCAILFRTPQLPKKSTWQKWVE